MPVLGFFRENYSAKVITISKMNARLLVSIVTTLDVPSNSNVKTSGVPASLYGARTAVPPFTETLLLFVG